MNMRRHTTNPDEPDPARRSGRPLVVAAALGVVALLAALLVPLGAGGLASASGPRHHRPRPTIVLVHGDWADASSWNAVIEPLQRKGYTVVAPPNPLRGPTSDAAYVASFLETIPGPIVLVAHSYGGFVATNAARGNANIRALVYIDAFIPDAGQTVAELAADSCIDPDTGLIPVPGPGGVVDVYLRREANGTYRGFDHCFANGVDRRQAAVLHATQRPAAFDQYFDPSGPPAWETIPSWSLIGTRDRVIPPSRQRAMSTNAGARITSVDVGHLSLVVRPDAVTRIIETAVDTTR